MGEMLYREETSGYTPDMKKKEPFNLRLDPDVMENMNGHAKRELQSRNGLIDRILRAYDADQKIRDLVRSFVAPSETSDND